MIQSLNIEKHVIAGSLRYPDRIYDIGYLDQKDFAVDNHRIIFGLIKNSVETNRAISPVLIAERLNKLGVTFQKAFTPLVYLEGLNKIPISMDGFIEAARVLKVMSIRRKIKEKADLISAKMDTLDTNDPAKVISISDEIYNETITSFDVIEEPRDVFEEAEFQVESRGNNPISSLGLITPYEDLNRFYSILRQGEISCICARPGNGKSTFLTDICWKTANITGKANPSDGPIPILYLDTEMKTETVINRMVASISGVPFFFIENGQWRMKEEWEAKVLAAFKYFKNFKFKHLFVPNLGTEELISVIRRWYYKYVGRGNPCIICYDYLKLTGDNVTDNWREHQIIGEKTNRFKALTDEIGAYFLTAIQMNRSGEQQNRKKDQFIEDSSAIALSDRIQWFANFVGAFRKMTLEEMALDRAVLKRNVTHKLVKFKSRYQGSEAQGFDDFVLRTIDGKQFPVTHYITYEVNNFNVEEVASVDRIIKMEEEELRPEIDVEKEEFKQDTRRVL